MKSLRFIACVLCLIIFCLYPYEISSQMAWTKTILTDKYTVACMLSAGNDLYAGTIGDGIYKSSDNGTTWSNLTKSSKAYYVFSIIEKGNALYAANYGEGIYKSTDKGASWTLIKSSPSKYIFSLIISGPNLIAGTWEGIYYSKDDNVWNKAVVNGPKKHEMGFSFIDSKKGLLAGSGSYIFNSRDNGKTWESSNVNSFFDVTSFFEKKDTLLSGTSGDGLIISTDGIAWIKKTPLISENELMNITSISTDSVGIQVSSENTNILNDGNKMINGKPDLRAKVVQYHKGSYYAGAFGGGLWKLDSKKNLSDLEARNSFELNTNLYPNPVKSNTFLTYDINQKADIRIELIYPNGRVFKSWHPGIQDAGRYQLDVRDLHLSSGIYYMRIQADLLSQVKKVIIID